jgi:Glycine-rich domain-containing protein-like
MTDVYALQHAVARYHAFVHSMLFHADASHFCPNSFLDLMASSPASFFVPTLDIDLAWHTHQLMAEKYKVDCGFYVGRFIDQSDSLPYLCHVYN